MFIYNPISTEIINGSSNPIFTDFYNYLFDFNTIYIGRFLVV